MARSFLRSLVALALLVGAHVASARNAVDSVGVTVADLERSVRFYTEVLDFERVAEWEEAGVEYERLYGVFGARVRVARLALGSEALELRQFLAPQGRPFPQDSRSNDRWFQHVAIIVSDMQRAYAVLREHGVARASVAPQTLPEWNRDAGGIEAFYFRDPDGHFLEVLHFPRDKGEARWQATDRLFLGIDHTAIVVANTAASLRYYRDMVGMRVVGTAENYGSEQERLNSVFGARLRITALRAEQGVGVELLDYLAPRSGRPMPIDTLASDLWHWQIAFERDDLAGVDAAVQAVSGQGDAPSFVSPGIVAIDGGSSALMLRDPDGHAAVLRGPAPRQQGATYGN
jgi:catechol 2,3-dioxygenase-like lactoylglutathione lyase family enzyme